MDVLLNRIEYEHIIWDADLIIFKFSALMTAIKDSKQITQFKYQS